MILRRIFGIVGRIATILSLLLCLVMAGLWVKSYWKPDRFSRYPYFSSTHEYRQDWIASDRGSVACVLWGFKIDDDWVGRMEAAKKDYPNRWERTKLSLDNPREHWWEWVVLVQVKKNSRSTVVPGVAGGVKAAVQYWFLVLMFSIGPASWGMRSWRMRRRILAGKCRNCGYDLRASPERCPECGAIV